MKTVLFSCLILLCLFVHLNAQNYNLGLRLEFYTYSLEKVRNANTYSSELTYASYPSVYVFYSNKIANQLSISFKPGILISDGDIGGYDLGVFGRFELLDNPIYLFTGLNLLFLNEDGGGTGIIYDIDSKLYFISLGAGYVISKHFNIDLGFYYSLHKEIGRVYISLGDESLNKKPTNLYNMIKLSLEFRR